MQDITQQAQNSAFCEAPIIVDLAPSINSQS